MSALNEQLLREHRRAQFIGDIFAQIFDLTVHEHPHPLLGRADRQTLGDGSADGINAPMGPAEATPPEGRRPDPPSPSPHLRLVEDDGTA